jgi:hypothetical protein
MRQHTKSAICGVLLSSILFSPILCSAQSTTLTLIEQLRAIDLISTAKGDAATPVVKNFKADPLNSTIPTEKQIKDELSTLPAGFVLGTAQNAGGGVSFFPESAVISGITDFVVNRAKDEVSISFLIGLRDHIASDELLKVLFKQTLVVANRLEASSAKQLLLPLRAAVTADIRAIPETLLENEKAIQGLQIDIEKLEKSRRLTRELNEQIK